MRKLIFAALFAAAACSNESTAPVDRAFRVSPGAAVSVDDAGISVKFLRVTEDSRCAKDVQCVWAGNGQIEIEVRNAGNVEVYQLNTTQGAKEVAVGNYRVILVALDPEPVSTSPIEPEDYRATLKVVRGDVVCTAEARPGLMVGIMDAATGATTGFSNVRITARDGSFEDAAEFEVFPAPPYNGPIPLAYERPGIYSVTVQASGYAPFTQNGVTVTADVCHVVTVGVTARLNRLD